MEAHMSCSPFPDDQKLCGYLLRKYLIDHGLLYSASPYIVIDIETTGLYPAQDHILQLGVCTKLSSKDSQYVVNTFYFKQPDEILNAYDSSEYVRKKKETGQKGYVKIDDVKHFGLEHKFIYKFLSSLLLAAEEGGYIILGHNLISFDIPWLEYHSKKAGISVKFNRKKILDTGAIYKALKAGLVPGSEEEPWEFFRRVKDTKIAGLKWNLGHCVSELGIVKQADLEYAHDAGTDCYMTACLYEAFRTYFMKYDEVDFEIFKDKIRVEFPSATLS